MKIKKKQKNISKQNPSKHNTHKLVLDVQMLKWAQAIVQKANI